MPLSTHHQPALDAASDNPEASPEAPSVVPAHAPESEAAQSPQPQPRSKRPLRWYQVTWPGVLLLSSVFGILAVLALPSLVGCGNKARQSEGKVTVTSLNRSQEAYFGKKGTFATSIPALETGIRADTTNYQFSIRTTKQAAFSYGTAHPGTQNLHSFVGAVFVLPAAGSRTPATVAIACESIQTGTVQLAEPILQAAKPTCAPGTRVLDLI